MFNLANPGGEHLKDVTLTDVINAIALLQKIDKEHAAFWVYQEGQENVLEVHKDLMIFGIFANNPKLEIKYQAKDWEEVTSFYQVFLNKDFDTLKSQFLAKK